MRQLVQLQSRCHQANTPSPASASLSDHTKPLWIAQQSGFDLARVIVKKDAAQQVSNCYNIGDITLDGIIKLKQASSYNGSHMEASISRGVAWKVAALKAHNACEAVIISIKG